MEGATKVLIVCRNRLLRESVARILVKKTGFEVVEAQAIASSFCRQIDESGADVLVLDSLEFLAGAAPFVRSHLTRCLLVAMEDDQNHFLAAIRYGARGYVLQDASAADVVSAVRTVAEGEAVCPLRYARLLFDFVTARAQELPKPPGRTQWGLTRREQQLIPLIGRGLSNKEIANHFTLSEQTVKNHIHRIMRKIGVSDRLSVFEAFQVHASASSTKDPGYSN